MDTFIFAASLANMFFATSGLLHFIVRHTYYAIFLLMTLESASLPVPSEVVLPAMGYLAAKMNPIINIYLGIAVAVAGSMVGITIDYSIAYFVGKEVVYKHLRTFHIKKKSLDAFDAWFRKNGNFAVFIGRLIPLVRGLVSLPAGFAKMPIKGFYLYSFLGTVIWDVVLTLFGYYALRTTNIYLLMVIVAAFGVLLYLVYVYAIRRIKKSTKRSRKIYERRGNR